MENREAISTKDAPSPDHTPRPFREQVTAFVVGLERSPQFNAHSWRTDNLVEIEAIALQ